MTSSAEPSPLFGCVAHLHPGVDAAAFASLVTQAVCGGAHVLATTGDDGAERPSLSLAGDEASVMSAITALAERAETLAALTVAPVRGATVAAAAALAQSCAARIGDVPDVSLQILAMRSLPVDYRVNLVGSDVALAGRVARLISEDPRGFPGIAAEGRLAPDGAAQVAITMTDFERTGFRTLYTAVEIIAKEGATDIRDSAIVGPVAAAAVDDELEQDVRLVGFEPERQIIEKALEGAGS